MYAFAPRTTRRARAGLFAVLIALIACLVALPIAVPAPPARAAGNTYYVKPTSSGAANCTSWDNACASLQTALGKASSDDAIWVATGTYTPGTSRTATFSLKNGVTIYGGFVGTETNLDQRDWQANPTILSGDLLGDDVDNDNDGIPDINFLDNAYHVVTSESNDTTAILDGFTITAGKANGDTPQSDGGGVYSYRSNPTLRNLIISGNTASWRGGGMHNGVSNPTLINVTIKNNSSNQPSASGGGMYNGVSNPKLINVTISNNYAYHDGGGMYNWNSSPTLINVTISGNQASVDGGDGGGMYNFSQSNPTLTNVTISGNRARFSGGGMYNKDSSPILTNVTIAGNDATWGSGIYNTSSSTPVLQNSIIWGNEPSYNRQVYGNTPSYNYSLAEDKDLTSTGTGNLDGTSITGPLFANPIANPATSTPTTAGDYRLLPGSAAIDQGNTAYLDEPQAGRDLNGDGDQNDTIDSDRADNPRIVNSIVDLGAHEAPVFTLSQVSGSGQEAIAGSAFANPLVVTVAISDSIDYPAYPVEGGLISYSGPASGASTTPLSTTATIDSSGQASASVAANNEVGSYTISTSAAGVSGSVDFSLTNLTAVTSITRTNTSPTNASSIDFTVTFDHAISGLTSSNFSLTSTGSVSGTITNVSGSSTIWTVTVASISGDGTLRLEMDNDTGVLPIGVGNLSYTTGEAYTIDNTAPAISITAAPDDPSGNTETSISFRAADGTGSGIASVACQLDGGTWEPCSSPVSYTGLSDGEHTVTVRATDNVGNNSSASHTWTADSTLPAAEAPRLYLPLVVRSSTSQPADAAPDLMGSISAAYQRRRSTRSTIQANPSGFAQHEVKTDEIL